MSTSRQYIPTKVALSVTGLSTLAAANYATSIAKDNSAAQPFEQMVEVSVTVGSTPSTSTGMQALVFAKASYDGGATWQSGPETGTTSTDEADLTFLGAVPVRTAGPHTKAFPVSAAFGCVPPMLKFIVRNDTGVTFTAGTVSLADMTPTAA